MSHEATSKLEHAVQYVICNTEPSRLGATRLNKVLWFADLFHYQKHGSTVTGADSYKKQEHGPVPHKINVVIGNLKMKGRIKEERTIVNSFGMRAYHALAEVNNGEFSASEIEALKEAIAYVLPMTSRQASEITHTHYWKALEIGEPMEIGPASIEAAEITDADIKWALTVTSA